MAKIGAEAVPEIGGLAHVKGLTLRAFEVVDARARGHRAHTAMHAVVRG
ncbi:MAG: hypothetical protein C1O27_001726 [Chloroflexi bacterium]|jgi:hypothetical protein|nr:MAG: hypothetical protein C1O27_001726 [Chloroflexota bacterium]